MSKHYKDIEQVKYGVATIDYLKGDDAWKLSISKDDDSIMFFTGQIGVMIGALTELRDKLEEANKLRNNRYER